MSAVSKRKVWHTGQILPQVSETLFRLYASLRRHFGYAEQWWPGTPLGIAFTTLLVQQCGWSVAYKAAGRLRERGYFELPRLAQADADAVRACLHPVSFAPTKSKRLIQLAQHILDRGFQQIEPYLQWASTEVVRHDLLSLPGIGDETADCMLLYASDTHPVFVVDAYTRRVFDRLHLLPNLDGSLWRSSYGNLKQFFQSHIFGSMSKYDSFVFCPDILREVALFRDFHAQIVELGRHHCLKTAPRCHVRGADGWKDYSICENHCTEDGCFHCPLIELCSYGSERLATNPG